MVSGMSVNNTASPWAKCAPTTPPCSIKARAAVVGTLGNEQLENSVWKSSTSSEKRACTETSSLRASKKRSSGTSRKCWRVARNWLGRGSRARTRPGWVKMWSTDGGLWRIFLKILSLFLSTHSIRSDNQVKLSSHSKLNRIIIEWSKPPGPSNSRHLLYASQGEMKTEKRFLISH